MPCVRVRVRERRLYEPAEDPRSLACRVAWHGPLAMAVAGVAAAVAGLPAGGVLQVTRPARHPKVPRRSIRHCEQKMSSGISTQASKCIAEEIDAGFTPSAKDPLLLPRHRLKPDSQIDGCERAPGVGGCPSETNEVRNKCGATARTAIL